MVLDHYNVVLMNLGTEASLFRQVPSAHALTHTNMLPLHVHYTPPLYIASKYYNMSCRVSSLAYNICSHEIHDAHCANCKGKWLMAVRYPVPSGSLTLVHPAILLVTYETSLLIRS